jgi:hypothetical protein
MATTPVAPACPIRLVSFRLAAKSSTEARRLFLDGEGHISAAPHWLPREQTSACSWASGLGLADRSPVAMG